MRRDWLGGGGNGCLLLKLLGPLAALQAARNYVLCDLPERLVGETRWIINVKK
jgi:hypothetical protein